MQTMLIFTIAISFEIKAGKITKVNNVVMLDRKKKYYNTEILTIGKLIDFEQKETSKGILNKLVFKVPNEYRTFEAIKFDRKDKTELSKGKYFSAIASDDILIFSKEGYVSKEMSVEGRSVLNVRL